MYTIIKPITSNDFTQYYFIRWALLRRPQGGEKGTEKDKYEHQSFHLMVKDLNNNCIGVGRIHELKNIAQIRYMAVKKAHRNRGIGVKLVSKLEIFTKGKKISKIFLNSRENAVRFYQKRGYSIIKKVKPSFGNIVHYRMEKVLNN